ncbi:MAG TPA: dienelactone hydrolase family protein [Planctomycetota bacterium]|nr:dienelactone hydrolase family protein [Planctomycetota bacterium]
MRHLLSAIAILLSLSLSAADDWAKAKLDKSPRHGEWVKIKQGNREVQAWVVYPEVKDKATAVLVIHEIFGMSDWVKLMADDLAEQGFIAIAPDLLSGMGEGGGGTDKVKDVGKAIRDLPPDQITADLNATVDYVSKLQACNGKVVACGFCWGGGQVFRFATNNKTLKAACPFYGDFQKKPEDLAKIACPVYGFYAENDARISGSVPATTDAMKAAGKTYEPVIYPKAGHGFMRAGEDPNGNEGNKKAREDGFKRLVEIIKKA